MNEKDVFQNTLVFLQRVQTTGTEEAAYLLACAEYFQKKLQPENGEKKDLKKVK